MYCSYEVLLDSLVVQCGLKRNSLAWFPASFVFLRFLLLFVLRYNGIAPTIIKYFNSLKRGNTYSSCTAATWVQFLFSRKSSWINVSLLPCSSYITSGSTKCFGYKVGNEEKNITGAVTYNLSWKLFWWLFDLQGGREVFRRKIECKNGP